MPCVPEGSLQQTDVSSRGNSNEWHRRQHTTPQWRREAAWKGGSLAQWNKQQGRLCSQVQGWGEGYIFSNTGVCTMCQGAPARRGVEKAARGTAAPPRPSPLAEGAPAVAWLALRRLLLKHGHGVLKAGARTGQAAPCHGVADRQAAGAAVLVVVAADGLGQGAAGPGEAEAEELAHAAAGVASGALGGLVAVHGRG